MSLQRADILHAVGTFRDLTFPAWTVVNQDGFSAFVRNATGDYTLLCTENIAFDESQAHAWPGANELLVVGALITTPGVVRVRVFDTLGNPADCELLNVEVKQVQTGPEGTGVLPPPPTPIVPVSLVTSVFGRVGAVVAQLGDYAASLVSNDSGVAGVTVADALDALAAAIPPPSPVSSVFGRVGAVVAQLGDYVATLIGNDSGVPGVTVADALDTLAAAIPPPAPVTSVFGRVGAVVAQLNDYAASLVDNDSSAPGATVMDALDGLQFNIGVLGVLVSMKQQSIGALRRFGGCRPAYNWAGGPACTGYGSFSQAADISGSSPIAAFPTLTNANPASQLKRLHAEGSTNAAGTNISLFDGQGQLVLGTEGWIAYFAFSTPEITDTHNLFVGMMRGTGNKDPGDTYHYPDKAGLYWDDLHANLHFVTTDAAGVPAYVDTGIARTTTDSFFLRMRCLAPGTAIEWELNTGSGGVAFGTAVANLPDPTVWLNAYFAVNNGLAPTVVPPAIDIGLMHFENVS